MEEVAIVNYDMGNITSISNAIRHLGYQVELVSSPDTLLKYSTIILPGVGAFPNAMNHLCEKGLDEAIIMAAKNGKKVIGVCLGMQLLFSESLEFGQNKGLGLVEGSVLPMSEKINLRIPHMGWNNIESRMKEFEEFEGDYYFVHSFYCTPVNQGDILFNTQYGFDFCSGVKKGKNIYGLQFHPEKSQKLGLSLLNKLLADA